MKLKKGYVVNQIADEGIIVPVDLNSVSETSYILNSVGLFLMQYIKEGCSFALLVAHLLETYDVDAITANHEVLAFIEKLKEWELLDE